MVNLAWEFTQRRNEAPNRVGLYFKDQEFTYLMLDEMSYQVANGIQAVGVQSGDIVGVYLKNSPEMVVTIYGIWKAGAVYGAYTSMLQEEELEHVLSDSGARVVITSTELLPRVERVRHSTRLQCIIVYGEEVTLPSDCIPAHKIFDKVASECAVSNVAEDDVAMVIYTSGTTGKPKGAMITHGGQRHSLTSLALRLRGGKAPPYPIAREGTSPNLVLTPLTHLGGINTLNFAYFVGRSVVLAERFFPRETFDMIRKHRIGSFMATPTIVQMMATYQGENIDMSSVRMVQCSGAPLPPEVKRRFEERFQIPVIEAYGGTETGFVAGWSLDDIASGRWKPGSVGKPYPGVRVVIVDEQGNEMAPRKSGEICVSGEGVGRGYLGQPQETEPTFEKGLVHTGDIGYLDEEGFLFIAGRKKDMIICGGFNVYPAELEDVLVRHPKITQVAVIGILDERLGEIPKAYVVPCPGETISAEEIMEYSRAQLAHYKAVRAIRVVDELPRLESGKIDKQKLREWELGVG